MPHINDLGLALVKEFEGCELVAYPDPGTGGDPWTVGFGHTGPEVCAGHTITQEQADELLRKDLESAERDVADATEVVLTSNQFSALVSFEYNTGSYGTSTLRELVNEQDFVGAAEQFERWAWAGGHKLEGLVRRRAAERALFSKR